MGLYINQMALPVGTKKIINTLKSNNLHHIEIFSSEDKKIWYYVGKIYDSIGNFVRLESSDEFTKNYTFNFMEKHPKKDEIGEDIVGAYNRLVVGKKCVILPEYGAKFVPTPSFVKEMERILFKKYNLRDLMERESRGREEFQNRDVV